jgi:hypothetical protein
MKKILSIIVAFGPAVCFTAPTFAAAPKAR